MSNVSKMDVSTIFEMFERINEKLDKRAGNKIESAHVDITAVNILSEQLGCVIEEVRKPAKVEHQHRHTIDTGSSKILLSLVGLAFIILGLSYVVGEQRRSISQYKKNDLKYRYIKMQGQANEENLYRLEQQFKYGDSIKVIRKQVEKYEELVKEQAERMKKESEELENLQQKIKTPKNRNMN